MTYVVARRRLNRNLFALAVGILAAALGLGAVLRGIGCRRPADLSVGRCGDPSTGQGLATTLAAGWTLADALGGSVLRVLLIVFCYLAATRLLQGELPSWLLVSDAANRTLDLLVSAVRSLQ